MTKDNWIVKLTNTNPRRQFLRSHPWHQFIKCKINNSESCELEILIRHRFFIRKRSNYKDFELTLHPIEMILGEIEKMVTLRRVSLAFKQA